MSKQSETIFEINGEKYDVVKRGLAQARQVSGIAQWLSKYGRMAFDKMDDDSAGGLELAVSVLGALDEEALVSAYQITFGLSREIAEQEFSIDVLIDGLITLYNNSPVVKKLADRFFSDQPSTDTEDSNSTQ